MKAKKMLANLHVLILGYLHVCWISVTFCAFGPGRSWRVRPGLERSCRGIEAVDGLSFVAACGGGGSVSTISVLLAILERSFRRQVEHWIPFPSTSQVIPLDGPS